MGTYTEEQLLQRFPDDRWVTLRGLDLHCRTAYGLIRLGYLERRPAGWVWEYRLTEKGKAVKRAVILKR